LDASGTTGLVIDNLLVTWLRAAASTQSLDASNMNQTRAYVLSALVLTMLSSYSRVAQSQDRNRLIDALASAPALVTYVEDGAADASVTNVDAASNRAATVNNPIPAVRDIVALGQRAIPLLIAHLDDTRSTNAKLCVNLPRGESKCTPVPVGYVVEDILIHIIRSSTIIQAECGDDGFGACIDAGYYFRPDAYQRRKEKLIALPQVHRVKANWLRAYRRGRIHFHRPNSLRIASNKSLDRSGGSVFRNLFGAANVREIAPPGQL
jgi:hypothetical protein